MLCFPGESEILNRSHPDVSPELESGSFGSMACTFYVGKLGPDTQENQKNSLLITKNSLLITKTGSDPIFMVKATEHP